MTILQITNGSIDPNWLISIGELVIGFFLVRTLVKMDSRMDKIERNNNIITKVLLQVLTKLGNSDPFYDNLSEQLNKEAE